MSRTTCVLTALVAALSFETALAQDDLSKLQGNWTMVSRECDGIFGSGREVKGGILSVEGNRYRSLLDGKSLSAVFTLDPGCKPKAIDFKYAEGPRKGETVKGIYKFEGDLFVLCRALQVETERPRDFVTRAGSCSLTVVWKRATNFAGR